MLRSIYFAIFDFYLSYCNLFLGSELYHSTNSKFTKKKAVRIINFQPRNFHTSPLFNQSSILKFQDKICLENLLFIKSSNNLLPSVCNTWFSVSSGQHNYETSGSTQGNLTKRFYKTDMGSIQ